MARALALYIALIAIFYVQTDGFTLYHNWLYVILKTFPCLALSAIVYLEQTPLKGEESFTHALGLLLGACGDFLISLYDGGLVPGAVVFGIGHLLYMSKFVNRMNQLSKELSCVIVLYGTLMTHFFIIPQLAAAPISTMILMIYAVVLCTTVVLSGSTYFYGTSNKNGKQNGDLIRFAGFGLFFISDSLLLLCHVGKTLPYHNLAILSTYFASQYMILAGATQQLIKGVSNYSKISILKNPTVSINGNKR
uniref:YhhN-like protein n=1 Tax=Panagrolaimus sp. ES5 TaxID=591445 RepID=A0AC34G9Z6_9BILA